MSDIDYKQLFENGQLVWTEPIHREILDRMYQAYLGQPEEKIFRNKYRAYLEAVHSEALEPVVVAPVVPEPSLPELPAEPVLPEPSPVAPEEAPPLSQSPVEVAQAPAEEEQKNEVPEEKSSEKPKRGKRSLSSPK